MGVWGVYSKKRATAMIGIGLCCAALLVTGISAALRWYEAYSGGPVFNAVDQPLEQLRVTRSGGREFTHRASVLSHRA